MMKRKTKRMISVFTVLAMIFCSLPLTVTATGVTQESEVPDEVVSEIYPSEDESSTLDVTDGITSDSDDLFKEYGDGSIVEIEARRDKNVKHFAMPDGTVQAIIYAKPVHRKDASGKWQEIDNTLSLDSSSYATRDGRISFAKDITSEGDIWQMSEDGYSIAMSYIQETLSSSSSKITMDSNVSFSSKINTATRVENQRNGENKTSWSSIDEARRVETQSSIVYQGIRNNTDLEYILDGDDIKENIIVNGKADEYVYRFALKLSGLSAFLTSNTVILSDEVTGEEKYVIPAPYMYDADGDISYAVEYSLAGQGNKYVLTVTADKSWINSKERSFPVVIDPSITRYLANDTYISSGTPNVNYGTSEELWVSSTKVSFLKFDLDIIPIPDGATITDVSMNLYFYYYSNVTSGELTADVYPAVFSWNEDTFTWNIAYELLNLGLSSTSCASITFPGDVGAYKSSPGSVSFSIMDAFEDWKDSNFTNNYGIAVKRTSGSNGSVILCSTESGKYPSLTVTYSEPRIPDGLYRIKNSVQNLYVDVAAGGTKSGTKIQQYTEAQQGYERNQLFKITWLGKDYHNVNLYTIRTMTNSEIGIAASSSGGEVIATTISSYSDILSETSSEHIWEISPMYGNGFYKIKNGTLLLSLPEETQSGVPITMSSELSDNSKWTLEPYDGEAINGTNKYVFANELNVGETCFYDFSIYSSITRCNVSISYVVTNENGTSTDKATIDSSTGKLLALKKGNIRIGVVCSSSNWNTIWHNVTIQNLPEGNYHIENVDTKKHIDIEGPSKLSGAILQQWDFHIGKQEIWYLSYVSDTSDYFRLKSLYSNLYLGVDSTNIVSIKQYDVQNDYTLWRAEVSASGNLKLFCKMTESGNKVLSIPLNANSNGTDLTQTTYTDNANYRDEWSLIACKDASLVALPETYDRVSFFSDVLTNLEDMGYEDNYDNKDDPLKGFTKDDLADIMRLSKITLIRAHGSKTSISAIGGSLYLSDMLSFPSNYLDYSELIIYGACSTAEGGAGGDNLVNATQSQGCQVVIGFEETIWNDEANIWCDKFFEELSNGSTVQQSCERAKDYVKESMFGDGSTREMGTDSFYIAGDRNAKFLN